MAVAWLYGSAVNAEPGAKRAPGAPKLETEGITWAWCWNEGPILCEPETFACWSPLR